jgi:hypothetical protein
VHLIRRLGQVECLDCRLVLEPGAALVRAGSPAPAASPDATLAEEVGRALERLLGRH